MFQKKEYTFDKVVRMVLGALAVIGTIWLVNILKNVLLPFLVATLIAYIFEPFVQYNRKLLNLKGRIIAVWVTLFEAFFFISMAVYFLAPVISAEMTEMANILKSYASSKHSDGIIPQELHAFLQSVIDFESLSQTLTQQEWMSMMEQALQASWDILSGSLSILMGIFNWCIVVLYVVFIMIDYERINKGFRNMIPPAYRQIVYSIGDDIKISMNHYFRGQALIALIVGILFAIGFLIIDMPMAILFGLFIGLLNLVPYLQLISLIPAIGLCIISSVGGGGDFWSIFIQCITVYCVVQAIQDLILTPRIMGKAMGLNPAIILLSLSIWGTLLGFVGLIIALPLTTLLLSYYEYYINGTGLPWRKKEAKAIEDVAEKPFE